MFFRCLSALLALACTARPSVLRVCADPNNLPFSNRSGEGLDNRVAEIIAKDLNAQLEFVWRRQRKSAVEKFLDQGDCDVMFGAPAGIPSALTTRPYYRSSYVFMSRRDGAPSISSLFDERLAKWRIGVQIVGDDYAPPAEMLAHRGLAANLAGFSQFDRPGEAEPSTAILDALDKGSVDVAIVWGPLAGYLIKHARVPLQMSAVQPAMFAGIPFAFDIAAAVNQRNPELRGQINQALSRECAAIQAVLAEFNIPQEDKTSCAPSQPQSASLR